ncbi:hypothetical protein [Agromyces sp. SYSU T00194]|uniref:hypothetical protein n=1 Tax=Agromyces chitinivorans TaxID=3158560 RepID=UPI00339B23BC
MAAALRRRRHRRLRARAQTTDAAGGTPLGARRFRGIRSSPVESRTTWITLGRGPPQFPSASVPGAT